MSDDKPFLQAAAESIVQRLEDRVLELETENASLRAMVGGPCQSCAKLNTENHFLQLNLKSILKNVRDGYLNACAEVALVEGSHKRGDANPKPLIASSFILTWQCSNCSTEHADPTLARCTTCGTRRQGNWR